MLKEYVKSIPPIYEALGAPESILLQSILQVLYKCPTSCMCQSFLSVIKLCAPEKVASVQTLIDDAMNPDVSYQKQPLDLRNQRTYAVKVCRFS